jgi:NOL1/NOP2/sun family putative RNA methylase
MIKLPQDYIDRTHALLGDEASSFLLSYEQPRVQGLRINPLKIQQDDPRFALLQRYFQLEPIPWCPTGYYYGDLARPGKHPYHAAGVYYIQEPSAMSSVEFLDPKPGDIVLDLAAAPGGKSTQIAAKLQGKGLLVANEIHPARAKILSENMERMGIANAVVTNAAPDKLSARFPAFFDKIMLDAPCSGEGMFRKDPAAIEEWSVDHIRMCAARQMDILPDAVSMLKPGGVLAYSTCTFNREENEDTIHVLLQRYPELELLATDRIWPHRQRGEGHFVAVLLKKGHLEEAARDIASRKKEGNGKAKQDKPNKALLDALQRYKAFAAETIPHYRLGEGEPLLFGEQLYWLPTAEGCPFRSHMLNGLKVPRPGLHLGELKKNRFEPSHALALALQSGSEPAALTYSITADSADVTAYLRGESLISSRQVNGWVVVTVDGFPLGWGKESAGQLKNHYPKGLRWPL